VKPTVREQLTRVGVFDRIGNENTHGNVDRTVHGQITARGGNRADA